MVVKGTLRDPKTWDRLVNDRFAGKQPILSPDESMRAAKRLYRFAMGKPFKGEVKITSGRRYSWVRGGALMVNPDKQELHTRGLRSIIHDLSHYAHARLHPKDAPHSIRQARLEGRMVTYAIRNGFLDGALAPKIKEAPAVVAPATKPDRVVQRYARMVARRDKWKREVERATRLLAKAEKETRDYERRHGDRLK